MSLDMHVKFEVRSFNRVLELLAFNAQKFRESSDPAGHTPFLKNFKGSCLDCPWEHARQFEVRSFNHFKLV